MNKISEGIRRIVLTCSVLAVLFWVIYVAIASGGFYGMDSTGWLIFIGGIPVSFIIPQAISRVIYWIKDGFSQNKNT